MTAAPKMACDGTTRPFSLGRISLLVITPPDLPDGLQ